MSRFIAALRRQNDAIAESNAKQNFCVMEPAVRRLEEDIVQRQLAIELTVYLLFMGIFLFYVITGIFAEEAYYMKYSIEQNLVTKPIVRDDPPVHMTFNDLTNSDDFWAWLQGPFSTAVYSGTGDNAAVIANNVHIIGKIRMRQYRVRPDSCTVYFGTAYTNLFTTCYADHSSSSESTSSMNRTNGNYTYSEAPGSVSYYFKSSGHSYGRNGYVLDIDPWASAATQSTFFTNLIADDYIDQATRAVIIVMNLYQPNVNIFANVVFQVEFQATGRVNTDMSYNFFRINESNSVETFRAAVSIIFIILVVYYLVMFILEFILRRQINGWFFLDVINLVLFFLALSYALALETNSVKNIDITTRDWIDLEIYGGYSTYAQRLNGVNVLLSFLKLFKFLRANVRLSVLWMTFSQGAGDFLNFVIMFMIMFIAFTTECYLAFGPGDENLGSFSKVMVALLNFIFSKGMDPDYNTFTDAADDVSWMAPVFFYSFVFLIVFVLMNIFMAVLLDSYTVVDVFIKQKLHQMADEKLFKRQAKEMRNKLKERAKESKVAAGEMAAREREEKKKKEKEEGKDSTERKALSKRFNELCYDFCFTWNICYRNVIERRLLARLKNRKVVERGYMTADDLESAIGSSVKNPKKFSRLLFKNNNVDLSTATRLHNEVRIIMAKAKKEHKGPKVGNYDFDEEQLAQELNETSRRRELSGKDEHKDRLDSVLNTLDFPVPRTVQNLHNPIFVFGNLLEDVMIRLGSELDTCVSYQRQMLKNISLLETQVDEASTAWSTSNQITRKANRDGTKKKIARAIVVTDDKKEGNGNNGSSVDPPGSGAGSGASSGAGSARPPARILQMEQNRQQAQNRDKSIEMKRFT
eukprot:GILK01009925.1.p1 GENE.GILK01009925.1~~GILK01009925.1.p1  ORF type:complete len:865 (-),score=214.29 GILK01009925.1:163-2757(-)